MSDPIVVIVPLINDDTRRTAAKLALSMYANEPCRICRRNIEPADLPSLVFAGYSRDGKARAAHRTCWDNFVELLQALPAERLYALANGAREETESGQFEATDGRTAL